MARGRIDMGGFSNGAVALLVPELALLGLPFYFKNVAEQDCAVDSHDQAGVATLLAKKGVKFLGWTESAPATSSARSRISSPADVKGLKARVGVQQGVGGDVGDARRQSRLRSASPKSPRRSRPAWPTSMPRVVTFYLPSGLAKVAPVLSRVELADAPRHRPHEQGGLRQAAGRPAQTRSTRRWLGAAPTQLRKEIRGFEAGSCATCT